MDIDATSTPLDVALAVAEKLEAMGIPYFVTGSVASGMIGEPRSTNDIDFVVQLGAEKGPEFIRQFGDAFYLNPETVERAVREKRSFNLIHTASAQKADFFVSAGDVYAGEQMRRRRATVVLSAPERSLFVASPEDILLSKLRWFRQGGGLSDRQWRDIRGIIKMRADALDFGYARRWAEKLGLSDLLEKALAET